MELSLTPSAMMNAAGALFFALVGLAILGLARRSRRGILIGGLALSFGLAYIASNLLVAPQDGWVLGIVGIASSAFALLLAHDLTRGIPRRTFLAYALVAGALGCVALGILVVDELGNGLPATLGTVALTGSAATMPILLAAAAARLASLPTSSPERPGLTSFLLAFGLFALFLAPRVATVQVRGPAGDASDLAPFALGLVTVLLIPVFAALSAGRDPRAPRRIWIAFLVASFAGLALVVVMEPPYRNEFGAYGIVRTIGAALLAIAVLKHDLLGVPLPDLAAKRGTLAAAALATLLIVAQVAQNFLSAQFGLMMGGVVAGALVFAASPIQRALEGRYPGPAPALRTSDEEIYRNALRVALRDKRLTRDEEIHLHRLAARLGLAGERAHELLVDVERETQERAP